jgi:hypothetical protein
MPRPSKPARDVPGCNVHKLRVERKLSQRMLAERCRPVLDHTTIRRLEMNRGYTQDTLERVAVALGKRVSDLFLPVELAEWGELPKEDRERLALNIRDAAAAYRYRKGKP